MFQLISSCFNNFTEEFFLMKEMIKNIGWLREAQRGPERPTEEFFLMKKKNVFWLQILCGKCPNAETCRNFKFKRIFFDYEKECFLIKNLQFLYFWKEFFLIVKKNFFDTSSVLKLELALFLYQWVSSSSSSSSSGSGSTICCGGA